MGTASPYIRQQLALTMSLKGTLREEGPGLPTPSPTHRQHRDLGLGRPAPRCPTQ